MVHNLDINQLSSYIILIRGCYLRIKSPEPIVVTCAVHSAISLRCRPFPLWQVFLIWTFGETAVCIWLSKSLRLPWGWAIILTSISSYYTLFYKMVRPMMSVEPPYLVCAVLRVNSCVTYHTCGLWTLCVGGSDFKFCRKVSWNLYRISEWVPRHNIIPLKIRISGNTFAAEEKLNICHRRCVSRFTSDVSII